jgi:hypothetical protein
MPKLAGFRLRTAIVTIAAAALSSAVIAPAASAASLVGWWPLNEGSGQTVHDWSGKGNHGKLGSTNGADSADPSWVSGWLGIDKALSFSEGDYIRIPDSPALEPATVTVSAFFRGGASPGKWRYLVSKGANGCKAASYGLYSGKNGGLGFYISDGKKFAVSPLALPSVWNGRWHHAAGTFDGKTVRLYVDGREVGSGKSTTLKVGYGLKQSDSGYIGSYRGSCDLFFSGRVDDIMVWSGALPISSVLGALRR